MRESYLRCRRRGVLIAANNAYLLLLCIFVPCHYAEYVLFFAFPWLNTLAYQALAQQGDATSVVSAFMEEEMCRSLQSAALELYEVIQLQCLIH